MRALWQEANQNARAARALVTQTYADSLSGKGDPPTPKQVADADMWENQADILGEELDRLAVDLLTSLHLRGWRPRAAAELLKRER